MALMKFREPNQVRWVGSRPAHNGTQLTAVKVVTDAEGTIYTVPVGETLFLCSMNAVIPVVAAGTVFMNIYTDAAAVYFYGMQESILAAQGGIYRYFTFWPPMELPSSYYIRIGSGAAGLTVRASIFGWVE